MIDCPPHAITIQTLFIECSHTPNAYSNNEKNGSSSLMSLNSRLKTNFAWLSFFLRYFQ